MQAPHTSSENLSTAVASTGALATLRTTTGTTAALLADDMLHPLPYSDVGELLAHRAAAVEPDPSQIPIPLPAANFAPLITAPGKVICCGHNYRAHIAEMGRTTPEFPTLFAKFTDTLTGANDDIVVSAEAAQSLDWEAELAVIVGATLRDADQATAAAGIAGYAIANDISVRAWQRHTGQWLPGKAVDRTTPIGPVMVTPADFDPGLGARIRCLVNSETVQDSRVDDLLFAPAALLSYISGFTTLRPGDVVLTGTPAGVGAAAQPPRHLRDGDKVVTEIVGLGRCSNSIRVQSAPSPTF